MMDPTMPPNQIATPDVAHGGTHRAQVAAGNTQLSLSDFGVFNRSGAGDH